MRMLKFMNNSYVIHKITGKYQGTVTAWYQPNGDLIDAEQIREPGGVSRKVKNAKIWNHVQKIGRRYEPNHKRWTENNNKRISGK